MAFDMVELKVAKAMGRFTLNNPTKSNSKGKDSNCKAKLLSYKDNRK